MYQPNINGIFLNFKFNKKYPISFQSFQFLNRQNIKGHSLLPLSFHGRTYPAKVGVLEAAGIFKSIPDYSADADVAELYNACKV